MNEEYIDWKSRALAAEAETLNLKNLCAHHGICTSCGEYYSHHYIEPFATCNCNTSEWYELTEYMKLQDELRKLREQNPVGEYEYYDSGKCLAYVDKTKAKYGCHDLYAAPVHAPAVPDGFVLIPKKISGDAIRKFTRAYNHGNSDFGAGWFALLEYLQSA